MTRRHVVVTAGPTREYVDPVRYLSNASSGRMGFAIAEAARARGDRVTLIAGPVALETPQRVERVDVVSARDLLAAVRAAFAEADALYMCAAVSDWRPRRRLRAKWRKSETDGDSTTLELVKNPDVLATVARRKGERLVVGFALETGDGLTRAKAKLVAKNADYIALNDASALDVERSSLTIVGRAGVVATWSKRTKRELAERLVELR
ncbi:MAG: phosphopantothenoylcysteine decarboxylase [Planctomycetota bacterium]